MIRYIKKLPTELTVALSGGIDSMAIYHFLSANRLRKVNAVYIDHCTENGLKAKIFLAEYFKTLGKDLTILKISDNKLPKQSQEEYWREERYRLLQPFINVVTGHHLDDVAETWVFSSLHGQSKLIPYSRNNVIRPFLPTEKSTFRKWLLDRNIPWIEDTSNNDTRYSRNRIRHIIMPEAIVINPGLKNMLRRKILEKYSNKISY